MASIEIKDCRLMDLSSRSKKLIKQADQLLAETKAAYERKWYGKLDPSVPFDYILCELEREEWKEIGCAVQILRSIVAASEYSTNLILTEGETVSLFKLINRLEGEETSK